MNLHTLKLTSKELLLFNNYVFIDKKNEIMVQVNIDLSEISNQFTFTRNDPPNNNTNPESPKQAT